MDGRRAFVTLPNDPELVDILAKNGVDISVSEGEAQGNYVSLLGNLLFPLIAFGGLFFLFRYCCLLIVAILVRRAPETATSACHARMAAQSSGIRSVSYWTQAVGAAEEKI